MYMYLAHAVHCKCVPVSFGVMAVQKWLHWQLEHNHCLDPLLSRVLEETCARYMYMYVNLSCKSLLSAA